ncbi:hypothetical protein [Pseudomonas sp. efr-133-TYG-103a]|uniref:hypothetical protein n=1 Tax=Pseudomonas sp. efr-133-TYG-103a TaxID=3040308 RepID=UPI0025534B99|nr:hypothetical protein [Pseudomonas sp. efr-133-TYG-103a]
MNLRLAPQGQGLLITDDFSTFRRSRSVIWPDVLGVPEGVDLPFEACRQHVHKLTHGAGDALRFIRGKPVKIGDRIVPLIKLKVWFFEKGMTMNHRVKQRVSERQRLHAAIGGAVQKDAVGVGNPRTARQKALQKVESHSPKRGRIVHQINAARRGACEFCQLASHVTQSAGVQVRCLSRFIREVVHLKLQGRLLAPPGIQPRR